MAEIPPFEVFGTSTTALFSLKIFRGEGMVLLGMNWKNGQPTPDFVGFAIEYQAPQSTQFTALLNRLAFPDGSGNVNPNILSTRLSPIQKFRWIHFPENPNLPGEYIYRVSPVFMDNQKNLSYRDFQIASIQLLTETYPGVMNIGYTRGFVSSQAFVDKFSDGGDISTLIPSNADQGLNFTTNNPKESEALDWMGFEARQMILNLLDQAIQDTTAQVRVTAYDFNEPEVVSRLVKLGNRLKVIIDDSSTHGKPGSAEDQAASQLMASAGAENVQRQHMGELQHNKTIAVSGQVQAAIGGSTNFSWRGFFVQNNNAVMVHGAVPVQLFFDAFDNLWNNPNQVSGFASTHSALWNDLQLPQISGKIAFSPHNASNALLQSLADDISTTSSSLMYSLAFLYQTPGPILNSIETVTNNNNLFVYGISDRAVGGLNLQKADGNLPVAFPENLLTHVPEPFKSEPSGGNGIRMHHKFVVIDFDKPNARVYMGSYNFSSSADLKNGENLFFFQDRRIAVSYMIQAVSMFDHYEFRDFESKSTAPQNKLYLHLPPQNPGENPWWLEDFTDAHKIMDREMFSKTAS